MSRYKEYLTEILPKIKEELLQLKPYTDRKVSLEKIQDEIDHRTAHINQQYTIKEGFVLRRAGNSILRELTKQLKEDPEIVEHLKNEDVRLEIRKNFELWMKILRS